jgi:hypothetical protein
MEEHGRKRPYTNRFSPYTNFATLVLGIAESLNSTFECDTTRIHRVQEFMDPDLINKSCVGLNEKLFS